jgi:RNA polymerase sigma factor (sigma-70 family)
MLLRPTRALSSPQGFWENDMKDDGLDLDRSIEESPPDFEIKEAGLPPVFGNQQKSEALDENVNAGGPLNMKRLYQRAAWKMKCVGCPLAETCGMELVHDAFIEVTRPDRIDEVRSAEALANTFIDRRSFNKKRDCRCGLTTELVEAGDGSEASQDEAGSTQATLPLSRYSSPERDPAQSYEHQRMLRVAYLQLDRDEKALFNLALREKFKAEEVARLMEITPEAARQRISRLRNKLRKLLS